MELCSSSCLGNVFGWFVSNIVLLAVPFNMKRRKPNQSNSHHRIKRECRGSVIGRGPYECTRASSTEKQWPVHSPYRCSRKENRCLHLQKQEDGGNTRVVCDLARWMMKRRTGHNVEGAFGGYVCCIALAPLFWKISLHNLKRSWSVSQYLYNGQGDKNTGALTVESVDVCVRHLPPRRQKAAGN